jgi:hypothetical protein
MCEPMTCSNSRTSLGVIFVKDASTVNRNLCDAQCIGAVEQPIDTGAAAGKCLEGIAKAATTLGTRCTRSRE